MLPCLSCTFLKRHARLDFGHMQFAIKTDWAAPPAQRMGKQRRYDTTALYRLAIIQRARQLGFTLDEIRQLFFGFGNVTRASERWQKLSLRKLAELDNLMDGIKAVRRLLKKMMQSCGCETLDQCGKGIFAAGVGTS